MNEYIADLHIHTVLSPCAGLEMGPVNIVKKAKEKKLDIIGITDHNSTLQCKTIKALAKKENIFVLCGAEVTTKEEIHCLAFFENDDNLNVFQEILERYLPDIPNNSNRFGYQLVVNEKEEIISEVNKLLISAINLGITALSKMVKDLNGIFIPAHIDRPSYSIISQLGFIPDDLLVDALEVSGLKPISELKKLIPKNKEITFITNSDAHHPDDIGKKVTKLGMEKIDYEEICYALHNKLNRYTI